MCIKIEKINQIFFSKEMEPQMAINIYFYICIDIGKSQFNLY
jgi:hypothetical protein